MRSGWIYVPEELSECRSRVDLSKDLLHSSPRRWWRCAVVGGGCGAKGCSGDIRGGGASGLLRWCGCIEGRSGWCSG